MGSFGFHDDSFGRMTLSGADNGGQDTDYHFWPTVLANGAEATWHTHAMGGEVRPELQGNRAQYGGPGIFDEDYPAGTFEHQDFNRCAAVTHATYILNAWAFDGGYCGDALAKANAAGDRLGYAFVVSSIAYNQSSGSPATTSVSVTVTQKGIAPFYYPLSLTLSCSGEDTLTAPGVNAIIAEGDTETFTFTLSATSACLGQVTVGLQSPAGDRMGAKA